MNDGRKQCFVFKKHPSQSVSDRNSLRDSAAAFSAISNNLSFVTEERDLLQANLTEKTKELERLQMMSKQSQSLYVLLIFSYLVSYSSSLPKRDCFFPMRPSHTQVVGSQFPRLHVQTFSFGGLSQQKKMTTFLSQVGAVCKGVSENGPSSTPSRDSKTVEDSELLLGA